MRNVFDIIDSDTQKQVESQSNQKLEDKIDLSSYILMPQKGKLSKKELYDELEKLITAVSKDEPQAMEQFKQHLCYALCKKLDFNKQSVVMFKGCEIRLIEHALCEFVRNPKQMSEVVKYLTANVPDYQVRSEKEDDRLYYMFYGYHTYQDSILEPYKKFGTKEMTEIYILLLQNGAQSRDAMINWFETSQYPMAFELAPVIEIMLQEKDPYVLNYLEKAFYEAKNSQQIYPVLKQNGFKFSPQIAMDQFAWNNGAENTKFLLKNGELDENIFSKQNVEEFLKNCGEYQKEMFLEKLKTINKSGIDDKKYTNKKTLSAQEQIDEILNQAIENQA